jgi:cytochrome c-type biogenesis protein CcmH
MMRVLLVLLVVIDATIGAALAVQPDERLADHALEERARTLSRELRCMVCQNQSIDDSDAPLARDLRLLVRERLKAGDSDQQILDFLVSRYGEFVLLKPSFTWHNVVLWGAPFLVLLIGAGVAFGAARRQRSASSPLSADEERALRELTGPR